MVSLLKELQNHSYREININLKDIFPRLKIEHIQRLFSGLPTSNLHQTILYVTTYMHQYGYSSVLSKYGFHDQEYPKFSGHCHQITPSLGLILKVLGFDVSYIECYRVREHFQETGIFEKVSPEEEQNPEVKEEFCRIKRIPYCCLEVLIDKESYYLNGKHIAVKDDRTIALLKPDCYIPLTGVFPHQDDPTKSGIYLKTITPKKNPNKINSSKQIVWQKQTYKDTSPEFFATFLRMKLEL